METNEPTYTISLKLRVSKAGPGISALDTVQYALSDYLEQMLPFLVRHHQEGVETGDFSDAIHAYEVIRTVHGIQRDIFDELLMIADKAAYPNVAHNQRINRDRTEEAAARYGELFGVDASEKEVGHER